MIWSREDIVREVRRQIVELDSLRRKVESESDVTEALERLEESQLRLLKKLNDYFRAKPDEKPGIPKGIPQPIRDYLEVLLDEPSLIRQLLEMVESDEPGAAVVIVGVTGPSPAPGPQFRGRNRIAPELDPPTMPAPYSLN